MFIYCKNRNLVAFGNSLRYLECRKNSETNLVLPNLQVFFSHQTFLAKVIKSEHWFRFHKMQHDQKNFTFQTLLDPSVYKLKIGNYINKPELSLGSRMSSGCTVSVRNAEIETNIRKLELNLGSRMGSSYTCLLYTSPSPRDRG